MTTTTTATTTTTTTTTTITKSSAPLRLARAALAPLFAALLASTALLAACAEDVPAGDPAAAAADTGSSDALPADFCERVLDKRCQDREACGRAPAAARALCVDQEMPACRAWVNGVTAALGRREIGFSPTAYAEALNTAPGGACSAEETDARFAAAIVGTTPSGSLCFAPAEGALLPYDPCELGTDCVKPDDSCGLSRCMHLRGQSEGCVDAPDSCGPHLVCQNDFCNAVARLGDFCDPEIGCYADKGQSVRCAPSGKEFRCEAGSPVGGPCTQPDDCESHLCVEGVCAERPAPGEPCDPNAKVSCAEGYSCELVGPEGFRCALRTGLPLGAGCASASTCARDLHCSTKSNVCTANVRTVGAACDGEDEASCEPGLRCSAEGTCQRSGELGDPCEPATGCNSGFVCTEKRCTAQCF